MATYRIKSASAPQEQPQEEGFLGGLKRVGTASGIKALEGVEGLANLVGVPKSYNPSEYLKQQYGLTPEYLEPQSSLESGIHRFSQAAPLAAGAGAALGGGALAGLVPAAIGSGAAALSRAFGAPELAQDVIQLGGELASGRFPTLTKTKKAADIAARASVKPSAQAVFKNTGTAFDTVLHNLGSAGEDIRSAVTKALRPVEEGLVKGKGNPIAMLDVRKWLNQAGKKWSPAQKLTFLTPVTEGITKDLIEYGATNPTFLKNLKTRDQLTMLQYLSTPVSEFLTKAPVVNKYIGPKYARLFESPERMIKGFYKFPAARSLYGDMALAALERNPERFVQVANILKEFVPGREEEMVEKPRWRIKSAK